MTQLMFQNAKQIHISTSPKDYAKGLLSVVLCGGQIKVDFANAFQGNSTDTVTIIRLPQYN